MNSEKRNYYLRNLAILLAMIALGVFMLCQSVRQPSLKQIFIFSGMYAYVFFWVVFHNLLLLEKLLLKRKYLFYLFSLFPSFYLWINLSGLSMKAVGFPQNITLDIFYFFVDTLIGSAIYLGYKYLQNQRQYYQAQALTRQIEIRQLKAQLNPHFFFNALNNIYSYNLDNNTYGNDLILKLSQLMRYILESAEKNKTSVNEEVAFIEDYLAFEKERLGERCEIIYSKNIEDGNGIIAPLLLFPFIENAIKHGTNRIAKSTIVINIEGSKDRVKLFVKNPINQPAGISTKTGLLNVSRRLELLFPEKHNLSIYQKDNNFIIELIVDYEEV